MHEYDREDLIKLCERAVVPCTEWCNRDSYSAQVNIVKIYKCLTAGIDFVICNNTDDRTIWIRFEGIELDKVQLGDSLNIDDLDDYYELVDPKHETEMFDSSASFYSETYIGYLPTKKVLDKCVGDDWYCCV